MTAYEDVKIAPSILAADFAQLGEQVKDADAGGAELIHIDVMDGRFVPNITMGALVVRALRPITTLELDVHLMIVEPERYIEDFADAGADTISVHIEASPNLHRTIQQIKATGCRAGVAINPHTPAESLAEVLPMLDVVLVMTVNPGFGGQSFIDSMTAKIATLRAMAKDVHNELDITVDGGINTQTASSAVQAGANILVAGSAVFGHQAGAAAGVKSLKAVLAQDLE